MTASSCVSKLVDKCWVTTRKYKLAIGGGVVAPLAGPDAISAFHSNIANSLSALDFQPLQRRFYVGSGLLRRVSRPGLKEKIQVISPH